jgi:hypothetical protein
MCEAVTQEESTSKAGKKAAGTLYDAWLLCWAGEDVCHVYRIYSFTLLVLLNLLVTLHVARASAAEHTNLLHVTA